MICWVMSRCEDDVHFEGVPEQELTKRLNNGDYDGYEFLHWRLNGPNFTVDNFPSRSMLIIKGGTVVQPKPVATVTKYEL